MIISFSGIMQLMGSVGCPAGADFTCLAGLFTLKGISLFHSSNAATSMFLAISTSALFPSSIIFSFGK
ncbi:hypothetical protein [Bacteroides thetaiotaomicron]|uniref:hypothetical protein n=1 Tax=Bacteroides thetaiotaomicron TaxID=818 RepID=UPI001CE27FEC|nr:hypothetical protein [Bacteroides thetaiotaomicron]MCA6033201.1 hypothetical protein [Bacteroides thetaiotaomicron]